MKRIFLAFLLLMLALPGYAQDAPMADTLRADGKIWVVVSTVLVMLIGFFAYLISVDGRLRKLEKK